MVAAGLVLASLLLPSATEVRVAVSVGNNIGLANDAVLRWAERDAARFDELAGGLGQTPAEHRWLVLGQNVPALLRVMGEARDLVHALRRQHRVLFLLFYSGHGDATALHLEGGKLPLSTLKALVREIGADTAVAFVDACHSGALVVGREKGDVGDAAGFAVSYQREPGMSGFAVVTSTGANEVAQESDQVQGSFFAHHLFSALSGSADADHDELVTLDEAYRYVYHQTLTQSHLSRAAPQHPRFEADVGGELGVVLTSLQQASLRLILPANLEGDLLVIDQASGNVVAEAFKAASAELTLALYAGRFRLQLRQGDRVLQGDLNAPWGGERTLDPSELTPRPLLEVLAKGNSGWARYWRLLGGAGLLFEQSSGQVGWVAQLETQYQLTPTWSCGVLFSGDGYGRATEILAISAWGLTAHATVGARWPLGPVLLRGDLGLGLLLQYEQAMRTDGLALQYRPSAWSSGPSARASVAVEVALYDDWFVALSVAYGFGLLTEAREVGVPQLSGRHRLHTQVMAGYDF